jgi:hypothetical protein
LEDLDSAPELVKKKVEMGTIKTKMKVPEKISEEVIKIAREMET